MTLKRPSISIRAEGNGFTVFQNDEMLKSPLQAPMVVPTRALAKAIGEELASQGEKIDVRKMPLMQMALTAIDVSVPNRENIIKGIMRYGETELLCQRATDPADLVAEQNKTWQPYLDWCQEAFGAVLCTGQGIIPFEQKKEALAALRGAVDKCDTFLLTGLNEACGTLGSLVLGLALMTGRTGVEAAFDAAELDHKWQNKKWGEDPVSQSRHADIKRDLAVCAQWFALLKR